MPLARVPINLQLLLLGACEEGSLYRVLTGLPEGTKVVEVRLDLIHPDCVWAIIEHESFEERPLRGPLPTRHLVFEYWKGEPR